MYSRGANSTGTVVLGLGCAALFSAIGLVIDVVKLHVFATLAAKHGVKGLYKKNLSDLTQKEQHELYISGQD